MTVKRKKETHRQKFDPCVAIIKPIYVYIMIEMNCQHKKFSISDHPDPTDVDVRLYGYEK